MRQGLICQGLFWKMILGIRGGGTEENNMGERKGVCGTFSSWTRPQATRDSLESQELQNEPQN